MFQVVLVSALVAAAGANRIHTVDKTETHVKWGASCDALQTRFHDRLVAFQASVDAIPDMDAMSRASQARVTMRTYGIIRTLRRARTCSWVTQNDSDEIEQARGIVQSLLAGNPCAEVARSELESGMSAETAAVEITSIRRAMSVLASDSCESSELPEETGNNEGTDAQGQAQLIEAEDRLADAVDGMEEGETSFIQTDSKAGSLLGFMRGVGVAFMMIFLLLACAASVALVGIAIGLVITILLELLGACNGPDCLALLIFPFVGGYGGVATGLVGCTYQLYTQLLPRVTQ